MNSGRFNKKQWQFHITAFSVANDYETAKEEWYLKKKDATPYKDNGVNYWQRFSEGETDGKFKCICGTAIRYRYRIHNRKTKRAISNIGSCCIKKYLNRYYDLIKEATKIEKERDRREREPERFCKGCLRPHMRLIGTPFCTRCEKDEIDMDIDTYLWLHHDQEDSLPVPPWLKFKSEMK